MLAEGGIFTSRYNCSIRLTQAECMEVGQEVPLDEDGCYEWPSTRVQLDRDRLTFESTASLTMLPKRVSAKIQLNPVLVTVNELVSFRSPRSVLIEMTCMAEVAVSERTEALNST